ncbi:hypothetical protein Ct61P_05713 [Colletotrichum tofieldiae]|nr:hypothetical protein Ct61P_05713 [Colletotrichum tofieldiae]
MSDREVFGKVLESLWVEMATTIIRNLDKFSLVHTAGSRGSVGHSSVYRNIAPMLSKHRCTQAFEAFLEYSQPGHEYCLTAALDKKPDEMVAAILSRDCPDPEDRSYCLVTRCQASADGQGKAYTV